MTKQETQYIQLCKDEQDSLSTTESRIPFKKI